MNQKQQQMLQMKIKSYVKTLIFGSTTSLVLLAAIAQAADPAGTWTWTTPGRNGGPDRVSTLTLQVSDSSLTGKLSVPGRDGQPVETSITDGKVDGDNVNFNVIRQFNGNSNTNIYSGTVTNDEIIGSIQFNRNGETQTRKWDAKRSTTAN
jgi:hypothetical protein